MTNLAASGSNRATFRLVLASTLLGLLLLATLVLCVWWAVDRIDTRSLEGEKASLTAAFQEELQRRKIEWFPLLELASIDLIARFVGAGYGAGLAFDLPGMPLPPGLRMLPLEGFAPVSFYALTLGKRSPMAGLFIQQAERVISRLKG